MSGDRIRVLVVDDSAFMRKLIPAILSRDPQIDVAGTAMDGRFALQKVGRLRPDVVTLDLDMPRMGGLETLRHLVVDHGLPVLVLSALSHEGAQLTMQALELGAVDFLAKPRGAAGGGLEALAGKLIEKVKMAARVAPRPLISDGGLRMADGGRSGREATGDREAGQVLAIGVSTGGPQALSYVLPQLPPDFPAGILVVQHMPEGFTRMFAQRLGNLSRLEVREAQDGDLVLPGRALVAPGNRHLTVVRRRLGIVAAVRGGPEVKGHRPSADVLFASVAAVYGARATGLVMTGMGEDGADGLGQLKAAGGMALAQSEASCVVAGMPRAAIERGYVDRVVPLEDLGQALMELCARGGRQDGAERG